MSARQEFLAWHAERGHAPVPEPDGGMSCDSCGEHLAPSAELDTEPDTVPELETECEEDPPEWPAWPARNDIEPELEPW